ncbi:MAG: hypothetical protein QOJ56_2987 [Mycobacterium sp.]|jgi:hypothetical protein|nr:hypothetical protein [Mycobacterium sp.]
MTDAERQLCDIFIYSLILLHVDDTGLTADNGLSDINAIAYACRQVKAITAAGDTPEQLALHRLAVLTENVIVTYVFPDRQVVRDWLIARAELLELRLTCN